MCELHGMIHRLQGLIEFSGVRNRGRVVQSQNEIVGFSLSGICEDLLLQSDRDERR